MSTYIPFITSLFFIPAFELASSRFTFALHINFSALLSALLSAPLSALLSAPLSAPGSIECPVVYLPSYRGDRCRDICLSSSRSFLPTFFYGCICLSLLSSRFCPPFSMAVSDSVLLPVSILRQFLLSCVFVSVWSVI